MKRSATVIVIAVSVAAAAFFPLVGRSQPAEESVARPTTKRAVLRTNRTGEDKGRVETPEEKSLAIQLREVYSGPKDKWPTPELGEGISLRELGLLPPVVHPDTNPYSKPKADLGQTLFFDARLSGNGSMACVSCHDAELGWGDGRATAFGHAVQPQKRNSMSLLNVGYGKHFFWDGRASSLEEQARMPIGNAGEMHSSMEDAAAAIGKVKGYSPLFNAAFGTPDVSADRIAMAIACFERTLTSRRSDFDDFLKGKPDALSDAAVRGLHLFRTKARCINCHSGPELTDGEFHDLGLSYYGRKLQDLGRYEITKKPEDVGRFKTPSLRNVTRNAPYMHNGLFDLKGVLNAYNAGMSTLRRGPGQENDPLFPTKDVLLRPLNLTQGELEDLLAFLESLEETRWRVRADVPVN